MGAFGGGGGGSSTRLGQGGNTGKGINISHVNIENMGVRDQSQVKIKFKKFEKSKFVPKDVPKSHNDDSFQPEQGRLLHHPPGSQRHRPTGSL